MKQIILAAVLTLAATAAQAQILAPVRIREATASGLHDQ